MERSPRRQRRKEETGKILGLPLCFLSQGWGLQSGREPVLLQHARPHSLVLSCLDAPPVEATGLHCFLFSTVLTTHLAPCSPNVRSEGPGHFLHDCFPSTSAPTPDEEFCLRLTLVLGPSKSLCTSSSMCALHRPPLSSCSSVPYRPTQPVH